MQRTCATSHCRAPGEDVNVPPATPSLIYLLVAVAFVAMYIPALVLATVVTVLRVSRRLDSSAECFDDLLRWITNTPIAFLTLTQIK
jgi:hypothetical protein